MIDVTDKTTADMFELGPREEVFDGLPWPTNTVQTKRRGRPATGNAKSTAERQAAFRRSKRNEGNMGMKNLNVWIETSVMFALRRLASHQGISREEVLTQLIKAADAAIVSKLDPLSDEYWQYQQGGLKDIDVTSND